MSYDTLAAFEIVGVPTPQGSHTAVTIGGKARLIEGSSTTGRAKHKSWRAAVTETARNIAEDEPYDGALSLEVTFRMPVPESRRRKAERNGGEWPCTVKPDIDKAVRALLDGLVAGGLIRDDARVFELEVMQWEVVGWTGAEIVLRRWTA